MSSRLWPLLLPLAAIALALLFSSIADSLSADCPVHQATGFHCPGCGGTRCFHDLLAGNWLGALRNHLLITVGIFSYCILSLYLIIRVTVLGKPAPRLSSISTLWIWAGLGLLALFTLLRNIPIWPFSLLAP